MPGIGKFVLHSNVIPDLPAGPYTLRVEQTIDAPDVSVDALDAHIEVTAPRFVLPPDQILSTFPPNKSRGAFSSRLPQIVLKRRTLPWEREVDGRLAAQPASIPRETPWLALVLLAEGEGALLSSQPIASCISAGAVLEGRNDAEVGTCIEVTADVVKKIFPARDELALLTHVREVNVEDTELMMGDDDAWLAVVVGNRLPQPGVEYRACLISIEGQYASLPTTHVIEEDTRFEVFDELATMRAAELKILADAAGSTIAGLTRAKSRSEVHAPRDAWSLAQPELELPVAAGHGAAITAHPAAFDVRAFNLRRYPVLAHWTFTCTEGGDFESRMRALDVGMLGTLLPPPGPAAPGKPAPLAKPRPEVLDTGHIALSATSRGGDASRVWYRGPLTPRIIEREERDAQGHLPLTHISDQAWILGPDGREDSSLAAAFEIGRLLALADPSFVAALLVWRNRGFELARSRQLFLAEPILRNFGAIDVGKGLAYRVGRSLLADLGADDGARFGAIRPLVDPAIDFARVTNVAPRELLAEAFHVDAATVDALFAGVPGTQVRVTPSPAAIDASLDMNRDLSAVRATLDAARARILGFAGGGDQ